MTKKEKSLYSSRLRASILQAALQGKLTRGNHHWKTIRLGEYVRIRTGHKDANAATPNGQYPFFTCAKDPSRIDIWAYDCECVLVSGNCNPHVSYYNGKFNAYQRLYVIESLDHSKLSVRFLYHFFKHHMTFATEKQRGTAEKYFRLKDLTDIELGLPPLSEQEEIVGKVEALLPLVEEYGKAEQARQNLEQKFPSRLRASILQNALQGKLTRGNHHWKTIRLGELVDLISGVSYNKGDVTSQGIRILRGGNLKEDSNLYLFDNDVFLPEHYAEEKNTVRKNDIVVVNSTGSSTVIGRAAIAHKDYPKTQIGAFLRIIRPKDATYAPWLSLIFRSPFYQAHIRAAGKGSNIKNLKSSYFLDFEIPLPPLSEQEEIVGKVEALLAEVDHLTTK